MKPILALFELLERLGASTNNTAFVNDEELRQWPSAALSAMKKQKLIEKARPASGVICHGCEDNCVMPVYTLPTNTKGSISNLSSFIICDKRDDTNRVPVPPERLSRWQCSVDSVCGFISTSLDLRRLPGKRDSAGRWEIGIVSGDKRSQMLCLESSDTLMLVAGSSKIPLAEFVEFHEGTYSLDAVQIRRLADSSTTADERYTPSKARIEARKLDTQAMYASWKKAYRTLQKKHPDMSDVWYSQKIAKMDIAHRCVAETIRKNMKK